MTVFYILVLIPVIIQHFVIKKNGLPYETKNKIALTVFFILLTVLVMFRHRSVGIDTENYIRIFNKFSAMPWPDVFGESVEMGFSYFNKIVSVFTSNYQVFLAIVVIVTVLMIYPTYRRLCTDASLTISLFVIMSTFVVLFSGIRQMIAVGIGFIAYECVRRRKIVPFILCVLFAMTFHTSAFMLAFMYPIYHAKITKKWLLVVIPAMLVVFVFNNQIFSVLAGILAQYTKYEATTTQVGAYAMIILFAALAVFSFVIPDEQNLDEETIGLRNFLLFALILQMFAPLHTLAMRMNYYYIIFIPLLLPKIIDSSSIRWKSVAVIGRHIMVGFFLVYFFISMHDGVLRVFPYHFFWEAV